MSKYKEKTIALEAVKVVEELGDVSMSELIVCLTERMKPSGHDVQILKDRNDTYFSQKVRNLKSHKNKIFFKNVITDNDRYYSKDTYKEKKKLSKSEYDIVLEKKKKNSERFRTVMVNYEKLNKEKKEIGDAGELFVLNDQKKRVKNTLPEFVKNIRHVSKMDGDGAGYDIRSFDKNGKIIYVEVKTTKGEKKNSFFMSATEYAFYELHKDNYMIARVYEFDKELNKGKVDYIAGADIEKRLVKEASSFKINYK